MKRYELCRIQNGMIESLYGVWFRMHDVQEELLAAEQRGYLRGREGMREEAATAAINSTNAEQCCCDPSVNYTCDTCYGVEMAYKAVCTIPIDPAGKEGCK